MPIDPTAAATAAGTTTSASSGSALQNLGADGFLQLLVAQLRYQNPMSPSDPNAMLQQTSQLAQVETLDGVAETQRQLLTLQQTAIAAGLVGREVSAANPDGTTMTGTVDAVRFADTGPLLVVDGTEIPLAAATELRAAT